MARSNLPRMDSLVNFVEDGELGGLRISTGIVLLRSQMLNFVNDQSSFVKLCFVKS